MLRKKPTKIKTVSEKITELVTRNANGQAGDSSDDEQSNEEPRVEDEFDEYEQPGDKRSSDIRKRNVRLLSEQNAKYRGKIATRKELEEEEEEEDCDEEDENDATDEDEVEGTESEQDSEDDDGDELGALIEFTDKLSKAGKRRGAAVADEEDDSEEELKSVKKSQKKQKSNADSEDDDENDMSSAASDEDDGEEEDEDDDDTEDDDDNDDEIESENADSDAAKADGNDIITETNQQAEVQKGQCVQNQLHIWERLLEMRIHTQKLLIKANQLSAPEVIQAEQENNEKLKSVAQESVCKVSKLLSTLLQLQHACAEQFSEQRAALKRTLKRPVPITTDSEAPPPPPLKRYAEHIAEHFEEFKPYRNAVLLKWDDRTRLLMPGAGAKKKSLNEDYNIIKKIENVLQNRSELITRSQVRKTGDDQSAAAEVADGAENGNGAPRLSAQVYDDSDFYHQQLRELIEYKTNTSISASEVSKQYVELQKLRQKMKKQVDTRASKGRKLRYTVHKKLINFMAPDDTTTTWTEESKDELYRSLFAA